VVALSDTEIRKKLRAFIKNNFCSAMNASLNDTDSFMEKALLIQQGYWKW